jgi:hypothetical protein
MNDDVNAQKLPAIGSVRIETRFPIICCVCNKYLLLNKDIRYISREEVITFKDNNSDKLYRFTQSVIAKFYCKDCLPKDYASVEKMPQMNNDTIPMPEESN